MKKVLSSSASSTFTTSKTTASTDANWDTPRNSSRSGCISTVFRRILRRRNVLPTPTHPDDYDRNTEFCQSENGRCSLDESILTEAPGMPNLVAKLMGLDSIPVGNSKSDLSSVTRSRSMNSAESLKGFEKMQGQQGRPRRTKSFREIPSFHELDDDNFYILIFDDGSKNKKLTSKERKSENGFTETEKLREGGGGKVFGEIKQSNGNRGKNRKESVYENKKENLIVARNSSKSILKDKTNVQDQKRTIDSGKHSVVKLQEPLSKKKDSEEGKTRIKKRKDDFLIVTENEADNNSQDSSPNSVLVDAQLPANANADNPEVSSRLTRSKSRRILWEELENSRNQSNPEKHETLILNNQGAKESKEKGDGLSKIVDSESMVHADILKESCKLAEEEMLKSVWKLKEAWKLEDYEKVGENLEADILYQMVDELIDQFTGF